MHGLLDDIGIYKWPLTAALYQAESAAHGASAVKKSKNRKRRPFVLLSERALPTYAAFGEAELSLDFRFNQAAVSAHLLPGKTISFELVTDDQVETCNLLGGMGRGHKDLFETGPFEAGHVTVFDLPESRARFYFRLQTRSGNQWDHEDFIYYMKAGPN